MRDLSRLFSILFYFLLIAGCDTVEPDETVDLQVHLQSGFGGHQVTIHFNRKLYYSAKLDSSEPLAGPVARFLTELPRDSNEAQVYWTRPIPGLVGLTGSRTLDFSLGESETYWIGLTLLWGGNNPDSLIFVVQDSAFLYL